MSPQMKYIPLDRLSHPMSYTYAGQVLDGPRHDALRILDVHEFGNLGVHDLQPSWPSWPDVVRHLGMVPVC